MSRSGMVSKQHNLHVAKMELTWFALISAQTFPSVYSCKDMPLFLDLECSPSSFLKGLPPDPCANIAHVFPFRSVFPLNLGPSLLGSGFLITVYKAQLNPIPQLGSFRTPFCLWRTGLAQRSSDLDQTSTFSSNLHSTPDLHSSRSSGFADRCFKCGETQMYFNLPHLYFMTR